MNRLFPSNGDDYYSSDTQSDGPYYIIRTWTDSVISNIDFKDPKSSTSLVGVTIPAGEDVFIADATSITFSSGTGLLYKR